MPCGAPFCDIGIGPYMKRIKGGRRQYFIDCPECQSTREVSCSVHSDVKAGKKRGLCATCATAFRKNFRSGSQFQVGHKLNKPNPNKKENDRLRKLKWREANREHVNAYFRRYHQEHLEDRRLQLRASRLKRRASGDIILTSKAIKTLLARHTVEGKICCYLCEAEIAAHWEIDHVTPISLGGTSVEANLRIACRSCNRKKSAKTVEQYRKDVSSTKG